MASPEPTDRRIRADVYRITRLYLEVERACRPPDVLEQFLTPAEYRRHRSRPRHPASHTREAVLPSDIGRIHLDRHLPGQITATIPTRESGERWGALVLHFARHTGRWRIDQLERLTRPTVARDAPTAPAAPTELDTRIQTIEGGASRRRRRPPRHHHPAPRTPPSRRRPRPDPRPACPTEGLETPPRRTRHRTRSAPPYPRAACGTRWR
jgi:hypothetical protein